MTFDQIDQVIASVQRRRDGISQTSAQISAVYGLWQWPNNRVVPSDETLLKLTEYALLFNGAVEPRLLTRAYESLRSQLPHYTPPKEAPVVEEPGVPAPVPKTQDQLGPAKSVEAGFEPGIDEHHQQTAGQQTTPLADAADYCYDRKNLKNLREKLWQECRNQAIQNSGGLSVVNHATARTLFDKEWSKVEAQMEKASREPSFNFDQMWKEVYVSGMSMTALDQRMAGWFAERGLPYSSIIPKNSAPRKIV
jgi:hypothetical protein